MNEGHIAPMTPLDQMLAQDIPVTSVLIRQIWKRGKAAGVQKHL